MEWARTNKNRGFLAAWPQFGGPAGLFLANLAVLFFSWFSGDQFLVWGWRIPFLLSIVMVAIGLWIRLGISETPVFQKVLDEERVERVPVLEVLKRQPKQVALTALLRMPEQAPGYIVGTFIFTYATTVLGAPRNSVLMAVLTQAVLGFLWVPVAGHLSDRIGRKRMYIIGSVLVGIFGFIYFGLLDTKVPSLMFIAIALSLLPMMTCYGPQAAMIAESFTPRLRYSGSSLGYQLASISRRPLAIYRYRAICHLSIQLADRSLYPRLRDHRPHRDGVTHGLHQQGHLRGIRKGLISPGGPRRRNHRPGGAADCLVEQSANISRRHSVLDVLLDEFRSDVVFL